MLLSFHFVIRRAEQNLFNIQGWQGAFVLLLFLLKTDTTLITFDIKISSSLLKKFCFCFSMLVVFLAVS